MALYCLRAALTAAATRGRHLAAAGDNSRTYVDTVDKEELAKFTGIAKSWWKEDGDFSALHALNHLRVQMVRDGLLATHVMPPQHEPHPFCLAGFHILDVGCGGGILSEPLARLGAKVTGLDASDEAVQVAKLHASRDPLTHRNTQYVCGTMEELVERQGESTQGRFHAVVASEVVEHVSNPEAFMHNCAAVLRPGGSLFVTTLNRTRVSYVLGVVVAEKIMRIVPPGTHDWEKFITPSEMRTILEENACQTHLVHGMMYNPVVNKWWWVPYTGMSYAMHAVKELTPTDQAIIDNQEVGKDK